MAKGKIKASKIPAAGNQIVAGTPNPTTSTLSFSFQYIDPAHAKFGFAGQATAYFCKVLERLKDISSLTPLEFTTNRNAALKSHCIEWETMQRLPFEIEHVLLGRARIARAFA